MRWWGQRAPFLKFTGKRKWETQDMQNPAVFVCWLVSEIRELTEKVLKHYSACEKCRVPSSPSPFLVQLVWVMSKNLQVQVTLMPMVQPSMKTGLKTMCKCHWEESSRKEEIRDWAQTMWNPCEREQKRRGKGTEMVLAFIKSRCISCINRRDDECNRWLKKPDWFGDKKSRLFTTGRNMLLY